MKATWVSDVRGHALRQQHLTDLQEQLGSSADAFIRGANAALELYSVSLSEQRKSSTVKQQNAQLATVERYALGLSKALKALDSDASWLLEVKRYGADTAHTPIDPVALRQLAANAKDCRIPVRRGARTNFALTNLVRRIALVYQEATGRRATNHQHGAFHRALLVVLRSANAETADLAPLLERAFPKKQPN
jgi:hypothetical protein